MIIPFFRDLPNPWIEPGSPTLQVYSLLSEPPGKPTSKKSWPNFKQRTFHAKMGMIQDRNGIDLTEAEDIKKRWKEHTEELYKKDLLFFLMTQITMMV